MSYPTPPGPRYADLQKFKNKYREWEHPLPSLPPEQHDQSPVLTTDDDKAIIDDREHDVFQLVLRSAVQYDHPTALYAFSKNSQGTSAAVSEAKETLRAANKHHAVGRGRYLGQDYEDLNHCNMPEGPAKEPWIRDSIEFSEARILSDDKIGPLIRELGQLLYFSHLNPRNLVLLGALEATYVKTMRRQYAKLNGIGEAVLSEDEDDEDVDDPHAHPDGSGYPDWFLQKDEPLP